MAVAENGNAAVQDPNPIVNAVKVTKTSLVAPTMKTEKPNCPLVTFDCPYITFYYNQKLLLYKLKHVDSDFESVVGKVSEGLSAALEHFYPLAGKIGKDEEGALVVECSGESLVGAEVMEAVAEGVSVEELAEGEATSLMQEVVPYTGVMNLEGFHRPLLAVQV